MSKKEKEPLYFHVRLIDLISEEYQNLVNLSSDYRNYCYSQGVTFACEERKDGWWIGFSRTSYKDMFNRRLGRLISKGRLRCKRKPLALYFGKEAPTFEDACVMFELLRFEFVWSLSDSAEE